MRLLKLSFILVSFVLVIFTFAHERYENIAPGGDPNFFDFIKWKLTRNKPSWPQLPAMRPTTTTPNFSTRTSDLTLTYINHSSFLIQVANKNILTDPVWSSHAGPFGEYGVKRSIYPGVDIDDLPKIDFILVSHSHYDHLDLPTIDKLTKQHKPQIITGLGVSKYINYCQEYYKNCTELNWWEKLEVADSKLSFHFVPAHHWSSRFFLDKNTSLWGGFIVQNDQDNLYFAGDTGFADGKIFKQIKEKYGNFRLSLLPIGAYKPGWFFSPMHTSPMEAVEISKILSSEYAIPMHFDTFELSDEEYQDPLNGLARALQDNNIDSFKILSPGETWKLP
jgi:L-ascorbate metabolism protein UlaG (beta-lactamase superfamily)